MTTYDQTLPLDLNEGWASLDFLPDQTLPLDLNEGWASLDLLVDQDLSVYIGEGWTAINLSIDQNLPVDMAEGWTAFTTPVITSLTPSEGPIAGGTLISITGSGFTGVTGVTFGGTSGTSVTFIDDEHVTVITPVSTIGIVDVVVTTTVGPSTLGDEFTYYAPLTIGSVSPTSGPIAGGTLVSITGTGFTGVNLTNGIEIDGVSRPVTFVSDTIIRFTTVAHTAGTVDIKVINTRANVTSTGAFSFTTAPTIISITNSAEPGGAARCPIVGGSTESVTIVGTGFIGITGVTFGGVPVTTYTVVNSTTITAKAPAHSAALAADVVVTNSVGSSGTAGTGNDFRYYAPLTVTSVDLPYGVRAGGNTVTLTGAGFLSTTAPIVYFGLELDDTEHLGTDVVVVDDTELTVKVPVFAHPYGAVPIGVKTDIA